MKVPFVSFEVMHSEIRAQLDEEYGKKRHT